MPKDNWPARTTTSGPSSLICKEIGRLSVSCNQYPKKGSLRFFSVHAVKLKKTSSKKGNTNFLNTTDSFILLLVHPSIFWPVQDKLVTNTQGHLLFLESPARQFRPYRYYLKTRVVHQDNLISPTRPLSHWSLV